MNGLTSFLEARRPLMRRQLRQLLGEGETRAPSGSEILSVLGMLLSEAGLDVHGLPTVDQPLIAEGGDPDGGSLLLLYQTDPADWRDGEGNPGGARADLIALLHGLVAVRHQIGELPLSVRLVCDPDRTRGSASLAGLPRQKADLCLWDGGGHSVGGPWIALGCHGLLHLRLRAQGADLGVGLGALVPNAAWRLVWALAALKSQSEEVGLGGFYDAVREPEAGEIEALALQAGELEREIQQRSELLGGLPASQLALVQAFSPSCSIIGLGCTTVPGHLPAGAWAELALTLVPQQEPETILQSYRRFLDSLELADVALETVVAYPGCETPPDALVIEHVRRALDASQPLPVSVLPYARRPAPLALLVDPEQTPVIGLSIGHAPWGMLEERTMQHACTLAYLLCQVPGLVRL